MAGIAEEVIIEIRAQMAQAMSSLQQIQGQLDTTTTKAQKTTKATDVMASGMIRKAGMIVAAYFGIKQVIAGIEFNAFIEQSEIAFSVIIGSSISAKNKMQELLDVTLQMPIKFKDAVSASRQLLAYGFGVNELIPQMRMLGDVATALKIPFGDIAYVYGTLRAQGRAYTRDLMQFAMRGIPIYENLAAVMGINVSEIQKLTSAGKVGFPEVEKAFQRMTGEGGVFGGMMGKMMNSLQGQLTIFGNMWDRTWGALTKGVSNVLVDQLKLLNKELIEAEFGIKLLGDRIGDLTLIVINSVGWLFRLNEAINNLWKITKLPKELEIAILAFQVLFKSGDLAAIAAKKGVKEYSIEIERVNNKRILPMQVQGLKSEGSSISKYFERLSDEYDKFIAHYKKEMKGEINAVLDYEQKKRIENLLENTKVGTKEYKEGIKKIDDMYEKEKEMLYDKIGLKKESMLSEITDEKALFDLWQYVEDKSAAISLGLSEREAIKIATHREDIRLLERQVDFEKLKSEYTGDETKSIQKQTALILAQLPPGNEGLRILIQEKSIRDIMNAQMKDSLDLQKTEIQNDMDSSLNYEDKINYAIKLYEIQLQTNENTLFGQALEIANRKAGIDLEKEFLKLKQSEYDIMLEGDEKHWENLKRQAVEQLKSGDTLGAAGTVAQTSLLEGTEIGSMFQGEGSSDPLMMFISMLIKAIGTEALMAVLNPITKALEMLSPMLKSVGEDILRPMLPIFRIFVDIIASVVIPVLKVLGWAITWLYNAVIRPMGNAIISLINMLIDAFNNLLGWLVGRIARLNYLAAIETQNEEEKQKAQEALIKALQAQLEIVNSNISYLVNKMKDLYNTEVTSLKDLLGVGAIREEEYAANIDALNEKFKDYVFPDIEIENMQLKTFEEISIKLDELYAIRDALEAGIEAGSVPIPPTIPAQTSPSVNEMHQCKNFIQDTFVNPSDQFSFASGSYNLPSDMNANIHKGELIVPNDFAEGIRSGKLTLGKSGSFGGDNYNIEINVGGTVISEGDLIDKIERGIRLRKQRGLVPA